MKKTLGLLTLTLLLMGCTEESTSNNEDVVVDEETIENEEVIIAKDVIVTWDIATDDEDSKDNNVYIRVDGTSYVMQYTVESDILGEFNVLEDTETYGITEDMILPIQSINGDDYTQYYLVNNNSESITIMKREFKATTDSYGEFIEFLIIDLDDNLNVTNF